uniref:Uncharacterized protein n=1 Tax=Babesia bovis TaxID=5865 RepID=A7AWG5_BABBO|eukprot:XP_001608961.1 hypothetical protein [Babesia bovis T2Bo]
MPNPGTSNTTCGTSRSLLDTAVSSARSSDIVAIGVSSPELSLIARYIDFKKQMSSSKDKTTQKFKNERQLISSYQHYIDVATATSEAGRDIIAIGRSKSVEAASFGDAAIKHKLDVLRLLSLYLRIGDVLKDATTQEAFRKASPSIYRAVIEEGVLYNFCRLHEAICTIDIDDGLLCRRKNVKVVAIVDHTLVTGLAKMINEKLPILIEDNAQPMTDVIQSIDNRSRKGWQRFLLWFIIIPALTVVSVILYQLYLYFSNRYRKSVPYFNATRNVDSLQPIRKNSQPYGDTTQPSRE